LKRRTWLEVILIAGLTAAGTAQERSPIESITVDAGHKTGKIKALQDLDNGPLCQHGIVDLTKYYKELGVRHVRLHDVPLTFDNSFDVNYVFPKWDADPDQPRNYDFAQTDFYLNTITSQSIEVIYRLGYSAEFKTAVHHSEPPLSYSKWADICAHIVRHHNQGWANGQHDGIRYWEIWNEPDGRQFWAGTPDQYYRLYEVTARKLKELDPSLKVGGPALAGDLAFLEGFLKYAHDRQLPVDFVSWHIYTQRPGEIVDRANKIHELMVRYGYPKAESILDEWNYGPSDWNALFVDADASRRYFDDTQNSLGAAFDAAVLIGLQDTPIDIATFYSGTTFMWGMFTSSGAPQKPYYAFLAFRRMLDSPVRLELAQGASPSVRALAGISEDGRTVRILMSNPSKDSRIVQVQLKDLPWTGPSQYEEQVVNDRYDLQTVGGTRTFSSSMLRENLTEQSVVLLTLRPAAQ
jgi:xylan 1,4-beta-xylosidase